MPQEADEITEEDLISGRGNDCHDFAGDGYIKRVSRRTHTERRNGAGAGCRRRISKRKTKSRICSQATTTHYILFFTDRGRVYRLKAYEVPETSRQARGQHINNFIQVEPGDKITAILPMPDMNAPGFLLMATENGEVKRSGLI